MNYFVPDGRFYSVNSVPYENDLIIPPQGGKRDPFCNVGFPCEASTERSAKLEEENDSRRKVS